jgi:hypothetical protein
MLVENVELTVRSITESNRSSGMKSPEKNVQLNQADDHFNDHVIISLRSSHLLKYFLFQLAGTLPLQNIKFIESRQFRPF